MLFQNSHKDTAIEYFSRVFQAPHILNELKDKKTTQDEIVSFLNPSAALSQSAQNPKKLILCESDGQE